MTVISRRARLAPGQKCGPPEPKPTWAGCGQHIEQALANVKQLLEEAGSRLEHICKITTYITDRGHREAIYNVIGRRLKGIHPCGTGLIVRGLAMPEMLVEIDIEAVIPEDEAQAA